MERLTDACWKNLDPWECCGQDYYCKRGCHDKGGCTNGCIVPKLYVRLAAYEDTGLTPEEIKATLTEPLFLRVAAKAFGVEADRLRELAEADKDGRVSVLPCKPRTDMINKILPKSPYLMERVHFAVAYVHKGSIYLMTQRTFEGGVKNGTIVSAATERAMEGKKNGDKTSL